MVQAVIRHSMTSLIPFSLFSGVRVQGLKEALRRLTAQDERNEGEGVRDIAKQSHLRPNLSHVGRAWCQTGTEGGQEEWQIPTSLLRVSILTCQDQKVS